MYADTVRRESKNYIKINAYRVYSLVFKNRNTPESTVRNDRCVRETEGEFVNNTCIRTCVRVYLYTRLYVAKRFEHNFHIKFT